MNPLDGPFIQDNQNIREIVDGIQKFPGIQNAPVIPPGGAASNYYSQHTLEAALTIKVVQDLSGVMANTTLEVKKMNEELQDLFAKTFTADALRSVIEKIVKQELQPLREIEDELMIARNEQRIIERRLRELEEKHGL